MRIPAPSFSMDRRIDVENSGRNCQFGAILGGADQLLILAEHAAKKKRGLFERLAGVGLSRKGDLPPQAEAEMRARQEPRMQAPELQQRPQVAQMPVTSPAQPAYDDDQLEIPAFLRRQAN